MVQHGILNAFMHQSKYSCLCFAIVLTLINNGQQQHFDHDTITLTLEEQDLNEYSCIVSKLQIKKSLHLTEMFTDFDNDSGRIVFDSAMLIDGVPTCPLPYDTHKQFFKSGFNDMCNYFQNDYFNQDYSEYKMTMPLLLNDANDFYTDEIQLTNQEIQFMKEIESFDDSIPKNNYYDNLSNTNMTRMNNLFKIAEYLQIKRLLTIIGARHASLMTNMDKNKMIRWLLENNLAEKQITIDNNGNDNNACNSNKECANSENDDGINVNKINTYSWVLLGHIVPFFSCCDIRTFSSISSESYVFANEWGNMNVNIDPIIKVLTNNNASTCLLLTNQEVSFYKPFLTLPQHKWSNNQNDIYDQLKPLTNDMTSSEGFSFKTLVFFGDTCTYNFHTLECKITTYQKSIDIRMHRGNRQYFSSISLKFGKFAEKVNFLARLRNIEHVIIDIAHICYSSSFNDLIGINDINNVKTIQIWAHSFRLIDFEEIYNINNEIEHIEIATKPNLCVSDDGTMEYRSVKNMQFLSKMTSLKQLLLVGNNLDDSFDFGALKTLTNLEVVRMEGNKFDYKLDTQCLDFAFLNDLPNLKRLYLGNNQIECIINFESIQQARQLEYLWLQKNSLLSSPVDFTKFDESKPLMNSLREISFAHMSLKYTRQDDNCFDLRFLKFMPNVERLYLTDNKIECIDNVAILQREDIKLQDLHLDKNNLLSFDFADLIGSNIQEICLQHNNLSFELLKNFDADTISKINPSTNILIAITQGNDDKLKQQVIPRVRIRIL